MYIGSRTLPVI